MPGLMTVKSNEQIDAEAEAERENLLPEHDAPVVSSLVAAVHAAWWRNKRARTEIDRELLSCLRQAQGEYDPEEKQLIAQQGGGNTIYMMLAATKITAATSWLADVMLPTDDLPVGVEPTEIPELPPEVYAELVQRTISQMREEAAESQPSQGDMRERIRQIEADVKERVNEQAKERANKMTRKLLDQLEEGGFRAAMEAFLDDFATYPTAILKGPIYRMKPKVEWAPGWVPIAHEELTVSFERVSPFDVYPSPDADNIDDGDFIERLRMTKAQIYALRDRPGYDTAAVDRVLRDEATGNLSHWLWTDSERDRLENHDDTWIQEKGRIDALHFWGHIDGRALIEWGMDSEEIDPLKPYHVEALVVGNECLRASVVDDPLQRRPYQAASMFSKPGQFWGEALPKRIRNTCKMLNSIARSLADNIAISSGPQVMVNVDALADGEDVTSIYPWKIHQVSYDLNAGTQARPIDFYQPSANANELLGVYREFETKADDESGVPRYAYGNEDVGGAGQTASGLSMLFDAASKGIRRAIGNIDAGVMRPLVEKLWMDEMRFGQDASLKGDGRIVPRGASKLLIADQAQQRRQAFLAGTNNPTDLQIMGMEGRAEVLREYAKALDMTTDRVVPSRQALEARLKKDAQQPDPEQQRQQAELQLEQQKAQQEAQQDQAELEQKEREDQRQYALDQQRFKLDTARYLSDEEQKTFQRRMGLQQTGRRENVAATGR